MNAPRIDAAKILEHVAKARAELAAARALIERSELVAEMLGGQPLDDFNEALRRLQWFTTVVEVRVRPAHRQRWLKGCEAALPAPPDTSAEIITGHE